MRPLKPRALAVESRAPQSSGTLIVAKPVTAPPLRAPIRASAPIIPPPLPFIPEAAPTDRQDAAFDVGVDEVFGVADFSATADLNQPTARVHAQAVPFDDFHSYTPTGPMMPRAMRYDSGIDDFYGFAPRPSEPIHLPQVHLPRMVTDHDLLKKKPGVVRRVAGKMMSFIVVTTLVAAAVILAFAFTFKVPLDKSSAKSLSYEKVVSYTQVSAVEREPVVAAPLAVQPHSLYSLSTPAPRAMPRSGPVASNRL